MSKFFFKKRQFLTSHFFHTFFRNLEHYGVKTRTRGAFSKLFLDFHFWTFIFVHFRKPKHFYNSKFMTEKYHQKNNYDIVTYYANKTNN